MKKTFRTTLAILLILCLALSLSSCSLFKTMREYSKKASEIEILPSPEDAGLYAAFNTALDNSVAQAVKMDSSTSYNVKDTKAENETGSAELFSKASGTLNKLILANAPGAQSATAEPASLTGTLLEKFDVASALSYKTSRNTANESVTDEKGEEVTNENGEVLKETVIKDNLATVEFLFYNDTVTEEAHTDEEGNDVAEVTERSFASDADIETVFGSPANKEAVLAEFDAVKDYVKVNDYSFTYDTCKVTAEMDLTAETVSSVSFEKVMLVTASVTGLGALENCGDMTVTFRLIKTDAYSFTFTESEE